MYFLPHPVAQRPINKLVLLDHVLADKLGADNDSLEVLAVFAVHLDMVACEALLYVFLDLSCT